MEFGRYVEISALSYITIGQYLQQITCNLKKAEADDPPAIGPQDIAFIKRLLLLLQKESDNMGLPVSSPLLAELAGNYHMQEVETHHIYMVKFQC